MKRWILVFSLWALALALPGCEATPFEEAASALEESRIDMSEGEGYGLVLYPNLRAGTRDLGRSMAASQTRLQGVTPRAVRDLLSNVEPPFESPVNDGLQYDGSIRISGRVK